MGVPNGLGTTLLKMMSLQLCILDIDTYSRGMSIHISKEKLEGGDNSHRSSLHFESQHALLNTCE